MSAERQRSASMAEERAEYARRRTSAEWEARLSRIVPPDDRDTFYPMGRLDRPYIQVCAPTREVRAELFNPEEFMRTQRYFDWGGASVIAIVARQMALILPNGAKVVWWTWEMGR